MGIRIQEVKTLPENLMIRNLHRAAHIFNKYAGCDILVVYSESKALPYEVYEFMAEQSHFQHLAGVRYPKGANLFYTKCFDGNVTIKDIVPCENMKTTSSKIEVLPQAVDLYSAKIYKIGKKDLGTLKNCFSMGIGNSKTVMGLDTREQKLPVPVTVMNRKITDFCSTPCSIFLIMKKEIGVKKYNQLVYEKTKDIFSKIEFPSDIKNKIDSTYIKSLCS